MRIGVGGWGASDGVSRIMRVRKQVMMLMIYDGLRREIAVDYPKVVATDDTL